MRYCIGQAALWPGSDGALWKGADQGPALHQQQLALQQSAQQFKLQMAFMQKQAQAAAQVQAPTFQPPAPPQTVDQNTLDQQRDLARAQARRFGFQATTLPGPGTTPAGGGGISTGTGTGTSTGSLPTTTNSGGPALGGSNPPLGGH